MHIPVTDTIVIDVQVDSSIIILVAKGDAASDPATSWQATQRVS